MRLLDLLAWRRRREEELDAEIASHLALATHDRVDDGEDPRDAYFAAHKEFGNVTLTREATRLSWGGRWIESALDLLRDLSYAVRLLRRSPGYSVVVIAVLAIGIAANIIAFSLYKALALTPPGGVEQSRSLLYIGARTPGGQVTPISYPDYRDLRDRAYPGLAAWAIQPLVLGHEQSGELLMAEFVTGNYFDALRVGVQHGRPLTPADTSSTAQPPVVVISDGLWRRSFGANANIVGATIRINSHPTTVVGIAASDFRGAMVGLSTDIFVPVTMQPLLTGRNALEQRNNRWIHAFMRPNDGMTREGAEALAITAGNAISAAHTDDSLQEGAVVVPVWEWPYGAQTYMLPAVGLMGAMAALLLVVVSANVAGLVLVRSLARRGETAARLTLGATRGRVLRQLIIESLVVAVPGALIGFMLPRYAEPFLGAAAANVSYPLYFNVSPDRFLVGFTVLLMVVTALVHGLAPALKLSRIDLSTVLKDDLSPRGSSKHRLRTVLVVAQVAVALVLLVGTALVLRTLEAAQRADAGFDPQHVTWAMFDARSGGHDEENGRLMYRRLLDVVRAEGGVEAASLATFVPLNIVDTMSWDAKPQGYQRRRGEDLSFAVNVVTSDYFRTMRIPIAAGREFDGRDEKAAAPPLIVNETFARRFWGNTAAAVGQRVETGGVLCTIIGVVRDIKYARLDEAARPYMYVPFSHFYMTSMTLQVRTNAEPAAVIARIRERARTIDPNLTILDSGAMVDQLRSATSLYETVARLVTIIGLMAAALAALGVYGLVAYTIRQSAHEIGLRTAVGATRAMILRQFLFRGLTLAAIGMAIGIAGSLMGTRLMAGLLFGVESTDTASFLSASILVLSSALVASFVPAWRGSRADPVVALRHQ